MEGQGIVLIANCRDWSFFDVRISRCSTPAKNFPLYLEAMSFLVDINGILGLFAWFTQILPNHSKIFESHLTKIYDAKDAYCCTDLWCYSDWGDSGRYQFQGWYSSYDLGLEVHIGIKWSACYSGDSPKRHRGNGWSGEWAPRDGLLAYFCFSHAQIRAELRFWPVNVYC